MLMDVDSDYAQFYNRLGRAGFAQQSFFSLGKLGKIGRVNHAAKG